ncbi:hypothetical protein M758_3G173700 [Ceratodon purpureus]|nr:hypothetical protein M758_3G173700 [Ceratodon purpureus]
MASEEDMASDEESVDAGGEADSDLPKPEFPNGRRPSTGTDIGFEESISESELTPSEAQIDDTPKSSSKARGSTLKRSSTGDDLGSGRQRTSNAGFGSAIFKPREPIKEGRGSRKQWGSGRAPKGLEGVDLENPGVKELLRRLSKIEASSSSSSGHEEQASPNPCLQRRGIKALHRAVQENEMPMRMAYEQLDELAANAERVKFAIERNRSLLTLQVKKANERVLRVAFMVWSLETEYHKQKKLQLRRALSWSIRGLMSRAFKGWRVLSKLGTKMKRFEASAIKILQRRKLGLTWKAWGDMVTEVRRTNENIKKEKRLRKSIDKQFKEDLAKKAIYVMRRFHLRRYFRFFQESRARVRITLLRRCMKGWWTSLSKNAHMRRSVQDDHLLRSVFYKWTTWVKGRKDLRERWQGYHRKLGRNLRNRTFMAFVDVVWERKRVRRLVERQLQKSNRRLLNRCFQGWISFMQMGAQKKMQNVQRFASKAEKKIEKLRLENERLSTIIDTGEWSKERVSDLVGAQQVLSAERVALTKLIGRLQRQHQLAVDQHGQQEHEIRHLKDQLMSENNYFQRNKLLVKGASRFNTLMRVMKNDMLKKGNTAAATAANPEIVYQVGNMAMDQVSVFPDGELHIKAVKPRKKGRWSNIIPNSSTTGTPSVVSNRPPLSSRSHTPITPLKPRIPEPRWQPDPPWQSYTRRS